MRSKVTIRDIAKLAKVSPATVSGVLNNSGKQTPSTVNLIHKIIEEVGYVPRRNKLRAENKRNRSKVQEVGLLIPDLNRSSANIDLVSKLHFGIEKVLSEKGIYLRSIFLNEQGEVSKKDIKGLKGMIVRGPFDKFPLKLDFKFPVVNVFDDSTIRAQVSIDNVTTASWPAQQAKNIKAKNVLSLYSPEANLPLKIRHTTFEDNMIKANIKCDVTTIDSFDFHELVNYDFVFCGGHDKDVNQVLDYCLNHKITKVNLSVVTTSDICLDKYNDLKIHWVNIDPEQVGIAAAKTLLQKIADKVEIKGRLLIPPKKYCQTSSS